MAILNTGIVKPASSDYDIPYSCRFNSKAHPGYGAEIAKMDFTPSSAGNQKIATISFWLKKSSVMGGGSGQMVMSAGNAFKFGFYADALTSDIGSTGSASTVEINQQTTGIFWMRDCAAWYHIVMTVDTTLVTLSDRVKIYLNGVRETRYTVPAGLAQDEATVINEQSILQTIGRTNAGGGGSTGWAFDGYLADFHMVDGLALGADSFGEFGEDYNEWKPIAYTGSHGTNGYHLDFSNTGQGQIAQATGTVAASSTQVAAGGLSATIDGVTAQGAGASGRTTNMEYTAWIGKDWGVGNTKTITGWQHWGSTDDGTSHSGSNVNSCTITLYGNSTDDTSSATALGGLTGLNFREMGKMYEMLSGLTTTTAYRYHWLKL